MKTRTGLTLLLAATAGFLAAPAAAQQPVSLKLSWDHCAGDGPVTDKSFACDSNTGSDVLYLSMILNDGVDRPDVGSVAFWVSVAPTTPTLPPWWDFLSCRHAAVQFDGWPPGTSAACTPWTDLQSLSVVSAAFDNSTAVTLSGGMALPAPGVTTLPAGREILLGKLTLRHSATTGTGACAGCLVPTCIALGEVDLQFASGAPTERFVGDPSSSVRWQGAYVSGFAPVPGHPDLGGYIPYHGNLGCTSGPVPARGRTWGILKTLYR